jgi:hypothetical protein
MEFHYNSDRCPVSAHISTPQESFLHHENSDNMPHYPDPQDLILVNSKLIRVSLISNLDQKKHFNSRLTFFFFLTSVTM